MDYLADYIVTSKGMSAKDIEKVGIPAMPARLEALRNKQIDAAILPAPFNDTAVKDGGTEIVKLYNKDIMISATAFLQDVISKNPDAIKGFYKAYDKAIDYINNNDIKGYSEDMRGNISLPDIKRNYLPKEENVQRVFDWSKENGIITKDLNAKDIISNVGIY